MISGCGAGKSFAFEDSPKLERLATVSKSSWKKEDFDNDPAEFNKQIQLLWVGETTLGIDIQTYAPDRPTDGHAQAGNLPLPLDSPLPPSPPLPAFFSSSTLAWAAWFLCQFSSFPLSFGWITAFCLDGRLLDMIDVGRVEAKRKVLPVDLIGVTKQSRLLQSDYKLSFNMTSDCSAPLLVGAQANS